MQHQILPYADSNIYDEMAKGKKGIWKEWKCSHIAEQMEYEKKKNHISSDFINLLRFVSHTIFVYI